MTAVCYVTLEYPVLSQTFVIDEVCALRDQGHDVMVVSLQGGAGADVALGQVRGRDRTTVAAVVRLLLRRPQAVRALAAGPLSLGLRWKLLAAAAEAKRRGVTAVHAHFVYRSADGAEVIARALGLGHSVTAHARDLFVPEGDLRRRLQAADRVVTVCDYNRRWLAEHHPDVIERVVVIPASTDVTEPPTLRARHDDEPVILAVGRLVEKKGFDLLLQALARMNGTWRAVIIGDGPLDADLRRQAEDLGITDRVTFAGALDHEQTLAAFRTADVLCAPFRIAADGDRDSMPVVVKEAMAAGLPVVATNVVGVPEMIVDGETGRLVPPEDAAAVADALDATIGDPAASAAMATRARRLVEARFDLRDQARRLAEEVFA
jgi:glycosyltransferase involved in cell wall biosynthesis